jgi:hypothetical protein
MNASLAQRREGAKFFSIPNNPFSPLMSTIPNSSLPWSSLRLCSLARNYFFPAIAKNRNVDSKLSPAKQFDKITLARAKTLWHNFVGHVMMLSSCRPNDSTQHLSTSLLP